MNPKTYVDQSTIGTWLVSQIKPRKGSQTSDKIERYMKAIANYEDGGYRLITPSQHEKNVERVRKYFIKAIDKMISKNPDQAQRLEHLKPNDQNTYSLQSFYNLHEQLRNL